TARGDSRDRRRRGLMTLLSSAEALAPVCALLEERFGLVLEPSTTMVEALASRMRSTGRDRSAYLDLVGSPAGRDELHALAMPLTNGESYFFRHEAQLRALIEVALPERMRSGKPLRILSAGCSTGEEPYSLAMLAAEQLPDDAVIEAIDLSREAIAQARRARYTAWSLRALSPERIRRHFQLVDGHYQLVAAIADRVRFEVRNLLDGDAQFWRPGAFDVIVCRNVSIYFSDPAKHRLLERFARALAPGGFLFLGPAESPRGISSAFRLRQSHETFYYQRGEADAPVLPAEPLDAATERIERLSSRRAELAQAPCTADPLAPVRDLLEQERYADAVSALETLPATVAARPSARLLLASARLNQGQSHEALALCEELKGSGDVSAEAFHLCALCLEQTGDFEGAIAQDERAIGLAPRFALPRMHLARLARRLGRPGRAQLEKALSLLVSEPPERLVPFAGGFTRAMLMQLCQAELRLCRGEG
ncbi:MAG TPA: CheR family methyltransferase, partial [Oscillatoriaceae cyanobacterium]